MIYYAETNLNTEAKQAAWYSRELVFPAAAKNTLELEYHVISGNSFLN